jgi:hypothetical protein
MKVHYDKKHPKLVFLYGEHCRRFKEPPRDIDWKDKCAACRSCCPDEYDKCRPAPKSLKIKRRKKKPRPEQKQKRQKPKSYETCRGPLMETCEKCPEFEKCEAFLFSKKPRWVIDKYSSELTPTEQKVLDYLESRASFKSGDDFGWCHPSHEKIAEATGVSKENMGTYIRSLESKGLIKQEWKRFQKGGKFVTHHAYCVIYFTRQKELEEKRPSTA